MLTPGQYAKLQPASVFPRATVMLFRSINNWKNLNNMRGLLFFTQRIDELTFPYTLDSYKSPTTSIQSLVVEADALLKEASVAGGDHLDKAINSAIKIIDELKRRIKGNWIAKHVCSLPIEDLLLENYENKSADEITRKLAILFSELDVESYIVEITDSIINLSSQSNQKTKLDFLAREFVAFLQYKGVSRDHINESLVNFFFEDNVIEDEKQFRYFCQTVYPHLHNFKVLVGVSSVFSSLDRQVLFNNNMEIIVNEREEIEQNEFDEITEISGFSSALMVMVDATDYNSALTRALAKIDAVSNFYKIFNHKESIENTSFAFVEQGCCEGIRKRVEAPQNNMHFIRDMRRFKAAKVLKKYNEHITLDIGRDRNKLLNIINIHGMSLQSKSEDIQLVNLWTCLETITPTGRNDSKIGNVVSRIIPILMLGYFNRLVINLLSDILRWDRKAFGECLRLSTNDRSVDLKQRFISLLTNPDDTAALSNLLARCGDFELLRYRIYCISELPKDQNKAFKKLEDHEDMVRWQLHRIYRTRNRIVHAGESPSFTKYLVENAHDFFDQTLLFCLEISAGKGTYNTFLKCFDYAEMRFKNYRAQLKSGTCESIVWTLPSNKDSSSIFLT